MNVRYSIILYPHRWAGALLLFAVAGLAWPAYQWIAAERAQVGAVQRTIDNQAAETRQWLDKSLLPIIAKLEQDADSRTKEALQTVDHTAREVAGPDGRIAALQATVAQIGDNAVKALDTRLGTVFGPAGKLVSDLQPAVEQINEGSKEIPSAIRDARFLLARSARAAGHLEQTLDKIEGAVPQVVADVDQVGANVKRATDASAEAAEETRTAMHNLAVATRPLPSWVRIPLSITGAVAPTAAGAVSAAAATGAFK